MKVKGFESEFLSNLRESVMRLSELFNQLFKGALEATKERLTAAILWFEERAELIHDFYTPVHPAAVRKPSRNRTMKSQLIFNKPRRINARSSC